MVSCDIDLLVCPLISSGIFAGNLPNPVEESAKQCCRAYKKFIQDYPEYDIDEVTVKEIDDTLHTARDNISDMITNYTFKWFTS